MKNSPLVGTPNQGTDMKISAMILIFKRNSTKYGEMKTSKMLMKNSPQKYMMILI